jgi:5-methylcytosine-specific restriction endonuclease McrA
VEKGVRLQSLRKKSKKIKLVQELDQSTKDAIISEYKEPDLKRWLVPKLRRISVQWPAREIAKKLSRIERGYHKCAMCGEKIHYKQIEMDHIVPVIKIDKTTKSIDWNEYLERLFCKVSNFQAICRVCHEAKTLLESNLRQEKRKGNNVSKIKRSLD